MAFGGLLPGSAPISTPPVGGLNLCPEFELLLTGEGRSFAARSRKLGGSGSQFTFLGNREEDADGFRTLRASYEWKAKGLEVDCLTVFAGEESAVVRKWTEVRNIGNEPQGLEHVSSAVLYHLGTLEEKRVRTEDLTIHIPYSSWSGEGKWRSQRPEDLGLTSSNASHFRATCLGSRSSAEYSPLCILEDHANGRSWFWQIEHSGSWHWEIGHLELQEQHGLYAVMGGPDEEHGHWWKRLAPGESFTSVPVAVGVVEGGFEEAIAELTRYRRTVCRKPHPIDDHLPLVFNDYMNCLWGNPTLETEMPLIDAAAEAGCEVYCMDSGWYAAPGEHWWPNVGGWEVNRERFPGDSFEKIFARIREKEMIPGLWLEAEAVGISSALAASAPEDWFLHRHGERVRYNRRYFWNLCHPDVLRHLDGVIDRLVDLYGIGYIKNDYNIDLLQGSEDGADSFGDGLLQQIRAFYRWIESVHQRHPHLIWENCAAGGLRCDYGILSRAQLQSSSDQESSLDYARMASANLVLVLPEQCATWCYPSAGDSLEMVAFNAVNCALGRVHCSGLLADLSAESKAVIHAALAAYKGYRELIARSVPVFPFGVSPAPDASFHCFGLLSEDKLLLAIWKFADQPVSFDLSNCADRFQVDWERVQVLIPAPSLVETRVFNDEGGFKIDFREGPRARLLELPRME